MATFPTSDRVLLALLGVGLAGTCTIIYFGRAAEAARREIKVAVSFEPSPRFDFGIRVEQAYASVPHRHTRFDPDSTSMTKEESSYLQSMFDLIDQAIVLRVATQGDYRHGATDETKHLAAMEEAQSYLQRLRAPPALEAFHEFVRRALEEQSAYFREWHEQGANFRFGAPGAVGLHPKVQSSSQALHQAYNALLNLYPGAAYRTQQAFFDGLCTLDLN
ncbi:MAG TPA: hypothetical protein VFD71_11905 [Planctomycetota bacterium]|nr:hypothetical protein [Planctomycetota bacterium]